jgi:predicted nucleic acid-binding protein
LRIYLDANVFIAALETDDVVSDAIWRLFDMAENGDGISLFTSELSIAEVLVKPIRDADHMTVQDYLELFSERRPFSTLPVSRTVLVEAAKFRAAGHKADKPRMVLPDFIHAATASLERCDLVLTADKRFPFNEGTNVHELNLTSLTDIVDQS